jgi:DNA-binding NarL/FixJ family response regulator
MQLAKTRTATVIWTSATAEEAFGKLSKDRPDLLILEIHLNGQDGLEFIKNLKPLYPDLRVLVHSSLSEDFYAARCLQAGAMGFLHKADPMGHLVPAMEKVLGGEVFLSTRATNKAIQSLTQNPLRPANGTGKDLSGKHLTDRELEIIILMARGDSCQDTADKLHISPRTVQVHRTNIRNKLGLDSAVRLHAYAVRFYGESAQHPDAGMHPVNTSVPLPAPSVRMNIPSPNTSSPRGGIGKLPSKKPMRRKSRR